MCLLFNNIHACALGTLIPVKVSPTNQFHVINQGTGMKLGIPAQGRPLLFSIFWLKKVINIELFFIEIILELLLCIMYCFMPFCISRGF